MRTLFMSLFLGVSLTLANTEPDVVAQVLNDIQKGDTTGLLINRYTNAAASAVFFLKSSGSLEDENLRHRVVCFSVELMRLSMKQGGQRDEQDVKAFVILMVKILRMDPSERIRKVATKSLLDIVPPRVLESHQTLVRLAAEERRDIATLVAYAFLPSSDTVWLAGIARMIKTESPMEQLQIDSILGRCGDQAAIDRLIERASDLQEIGEVALSELVNALAFVPSERVQKFLGVGLRSDAVVTLVGGGTIPWRNCCARALVRMHRHNQGFPVKKDDYMYSDDELSKIEEWCINNLGLSSPGGAWKSLRVTPAIQL